MKLIYAATLTTVLVASCARAPERLVAEDGSVLHFTSSTSFTYSRPTLPPLKCDWTLRGHISPAEETAPATCSDGIERQYKRMVPIYYAIWRSYFDGKTFEEPSSSTP